MSEKSQQQNPERAEWVQVSVADVPSAHRVPSRSGSVLGTDAPSGAHIARRVRRSRAVIVQKHSTELRHVPGIGGDDGERAQAESR